MKIPVPIHKQHQKVACMYYSWSQDRRKWLASSKNEASANLLPITINGKPYCMAKASGRVG